MLKDLCSLLLIGIATSVWAEDDGIPVDLAAYAKRPLLPDFTAGRNPPYGLTQVKRCWPRMWRSLTLVTTPSNKEAIRAERDYMIDLHRQVLNLVREGQSWDQLYRNVKFSDEVKTWIGFEKMHTLNIAGMYRWVSNHRRGNW